jgi:hypothetical protein
LNPILRRRVLALALISIFLYAKGWGQSIVSGSVLDSTKLVPVKGVRVHSTGGSISYTDSVGHYRILVNPNDSIYFVFRNKSTVRFPVNKIDFPGQFDISLQIRVYDKYKVMQEVVVFGKNYRTDSLRNREEYAPVFNYEKPGIGSVSSATPGGVVGMDVDAFINMFRFRKKKSMLSFQRRLVEEEQEKYVNYRFSKKIVKQLTKLESPAIDSFMVWYRPPYEFAAHTTDVEFYQYIIDASKEFKQRAGMRPDMKKD